MQITNDWQLERFPRVIRCRPYGFLHVTKTTYCSSGVIHKIKDFPKKRKKAYAYVIKLVKSHLLIWLKEIYQNRRSQMSAERNELNLTYKVLSKTSSKEIVFFYGSKMFTQDILRKNADWTLEHFEMNGELAKMIKTRNKSKTINLKNNNTITQ